MIDLEIVWGGKAHHLTLDDGEHGVGRAHDNAVQIADARVSKYHARMRIEGDRLFVHDLGSTNGTEVDGSPVGEEEVEVPPHSTVRFAGASARRRTAGATTTHHLFQEEEVSSKLSYNVSQGFTDKARDRIVELSSGLFELLASDRDTGEMETAACKFVSGIVTADRVVLLEDQGEATETRPRAKWIQKGDKDAKLRLSTSIVRQVIQNRNAVLVANPLDDPKFGAHQSIVDLNLRSAMAAPLFDNERVRGILYVDTASPGVQYTKEDLQVLTATANAVAVKLRNISLEREMKTAARIQQGMLPRGLNPPPGYELDAHQVMCRSVGGDLYHCLPRPNGNLFLALGDVAGKGMPAALAMGAAIVLIGMLAEIEGELDELTGHLHRQLFRSLTAEQFITVFLGELNAETGHMRYVNAGHEPPLLVHRDGSITPLENTGMPVAMMDEIPIATSEVTLAPGELLAVFSDGIPEATTDGQTFMGQEPVEAILQEHRDEPLSGIRERIVKRVEEFLKGEPNSDDVTLMLLRRSAS